MAKMEIMDKMMQMKTHIMWIVKVEQEEILDMEFLEVRVQK